MSKQGTRDLRGKPKTQPLSCCVLATVGMGPVSGSIAFYEHMATDGGLPTDFYPSVLLGTEVPCGHARASCSGGQWADSLVPGPNSLWWLKPKKE